MIVGLSGRKQHGKDTIANILQKKVPNIKRLSFATPLKEAVRHMFGFTESQMYGEEKDSLDSRYGVSPRHVLQQLGTNWVRNRLLLDGIVKHLPHNDSPSLWISRMADNLCAADSHVVITDVRFRDEAELILNKGGHIWGVQRGGLEHKDCHASENVENEVWALAKERRAFTFIDNSSTLKDLKAKVTYLIPLFFSAN